MPACAGHRGAGGECRKGGGAGLSGLSAHRHLRQLGAAPHCHLAGAQQLKGLHNDLLDIGFALSDAVSEGLVAEPVWTDPLSVIVPVRHPLLAHAEVPLDEALKFPLVLCHPDAGSGCHHQIQAVLQGASKPLKLVDQVTSLGVMLTLVGAGYGLGFAIASQVQTLNRPDITVRPLAGTPPMLSTYLLRRSAEPSEPMKRFLQRAREEFLPKGDEPAS